MPVSLLDTNSLPIIIIIIIIIINVLLLWAVLSFSSSAVHSIFPPLLLCYHDYDRR
jgi:hypothetical protein